MDDLDRLRGSDDGRDALEEPLTDYHPRSRVPWIGLILLLTAVAIGLWWWAPRSTPTPAPGRATSPVTGGSGAPRGIRAAVSASATLTRPCQGSATSTGTCARSSRPSLAPRTRRAPRLRRPRAAIRRQRRGCRARGLSGRPGARRRARGAFSVTTVNGMTVVDPASYARYDGLVRMVGDLDPGGSPESTDA